MRSLADKTDDDSPSQSTSASEALSTACALRFPHLQSGSAVVNVTTMAGLVGVPGVSLYGAAKAGLNTLTAVAAQEQGPRGIRVNAVAPGLIMTQPVKMGSEDYVQASIAGFPLGRAGELEEVAKVIAFLLSDESSYVTGSVLRVERWIACHGSLRTVVEASRFTQKAERAVGGSVVVSGKHPQQALLK